MQVHYQLDQLPKFRNAVLTIGSFDGLHRGHQQLLHRVNRLAQKRSGESVVITFDPHPRQVIYPNDNSLQLLTSTREKAVLLEGFGVDHLVVVPFTVAFSRMSADEYISDFLVRYFSPSCIVIGHDHRFGLNRQGDISFLSWHGEKLGYEVVQIAPQEVENITVSSTKIRNALLEGKVATANALLGHNYSLDGTVVKGRQLGRTIGFPTANIAVTFPHKLIPAEGIYAARAKWGSQTLEGMLYIGRRPTVGSDLRQTIELNIFDFNRDLYGENLQVELIEFVREDRHLPDLAALQQQLADDEVQSRAVLAKKKSNLRIRPSHDTAVVILNYNGRQYLESFLPALVDSMIPGCRIVIADNKSTDDSVPWLNENYPKLTLIELPENYGFAGGYNEALKRVDADFFVLLNSDIEVSKNWLQPCLDILMNDPDVGACQPKILAQQRKTHFEYAGASGGWMDYLGYPFCRGRIFAHTEEDVGQYNHPTEIFWASGAALFIRAALFEQLGGFEAEYFAHAEEIDLCWRLKRAGYKVVIEPKSVVYHVGGGTLAYNTPRKTYLNFRNTLITSFKNEPGLKLFWWLPFRLFLDGLAGCLFLIQGNWLHILAIIRAHWHFYPRIRFWYRRRQVRKQQIKAVSIGPSRVSYGRLDESVILHYYLKQHREFARIVKAESSYSAPKEVAAVSEH